VQVALLIHTAVNKASVPLAGHDLAAVAEGLKVLLLLSTCMASKGEAAQVGHRVPGGPLVHTCPLSLVCQLDYVLLAMTSQYYI
jgi:hypothetical protein